MDLVAVHESDRAKRLTEDRQHESASAISSITSSSSAATVGGAAAGESYRGVRSADPRGSAAAGWSIAPDGENPSGASLGEHPGPESRVEIPREFAEGAAPGRSLVLSDANLESPDGH
jgi:hypothetical protein